VNEILEPLALIPGVRLAALISQDGMPIALCEGNRPKEDTEERDAVAAAEDLHAFAGLAAGWLTEMGRAVAPLSWEDPTRVVLKATRGALILQCGPGAVLLTVLEHGVAPEELRVPMEGAVARMSRLLRGMGGRKGESNTPPGIFPVRNSTDTTGNDPREIAGNPLSETSGEQ